MVEGAAALLTPPPPWADSRLQAGWRWARSSIQARAQRFCAGSTLLPALQPWVSTENFLEAQFSPL